MLPFYLQHISNSHTHVFEPAFKERMSASLTLSKWGHFLQTKDKVFVLALCRKDIEEYRPYPHIVLNMCLLKHICPHFECVDAKIVLDLIYLGTFFSLMTHTRDLASNAIPSMCKVF